MKKGFLIGLLVGVLFGIPISQAAGPKIYGDNGYLVGFTVNDEDGDEVCSDPFVNVKLREIECD